MSFDAFIESAWSDHGDRPQEVGDRLATSIVRIESAAHIAPYVRLVVHVYGEHLGQWRAGIDLLLSMRSLTAWDASPAVVGAVARGVATLRYAGGERAVLDGLSVEDRIAVLAAASSVLLGRNDFEHAIAAYAEATGLAETDLPKGSPAIRALAAGGNNLAAALETKADREAAETHAMVAAAESGLRYWKLAGTWLEEERAEYRLARSLLQAGDHDGAIRSALRCIEVCSKHDAPPFEQFFGHAVLAIAQRAAGEREAFVSSRRRALHCYERIDPNERRWCEPELSELGG
jgi:tetratricopeptide (TPR) repeat protein